MYRYYTDELDALDRWVEEHSLERDFKDREDCKFQSVQINASLFASVHDLLDATSPGIKTFYRHLEHHLEQNLGLRVLIMDATEPMELDGYVCRFAEIAVHPEDRAAFLDGFWGFIKHRTNSHEELLLHPAKWGLLPEYAIHAVDEWNRQTQVRAFHMAAAEWQERVTALS